MKGKLSALCVTLLALSLFGRASCIAAESDSVFDYPIADADQHGPLRALAHDLRAAGTVRADFVQTKHIAALTRPLISRGELLVSPPTGVVWKQREPFAQTFVVTGSGIRELREDGAVVDALPAGREAVEGFTRSFLAVFMTDLAALERDYQVFYRRSDEGWVLGLQPKGAGARRIIERISITGRETPHRVVIKEANGDHSEISLKTTATSAELRGEERRLLTHGSEETPVELRD